jgi:hypothetical protein
MQARSNRPAMASLGVKAFYSITTLAHASGVTYQLMRRMLEANGVTFIRSRRSILVPLSEIRSHAPMVWNSLMAAEILRLHAAAEVQASAGEHRSAGSGDTGRDRR